MAPPWYLLLPLSLFWPASVRSFQIVSTRAVPASPVEGSNVVIGCNADASFEYCIWKSPK